MIRSQILLGAGFAFFFCVSPPEPHAQSEGSDKPQCFTVRVRLDGKLVDGPQVITFRTKAGESTASVSGNCFAVPPAVLKDQVIDVAFTIPKSKISLSTISTGFLKGAWDVDLYDDKRLARNIVFPRNARVRETCAVVFHVGDRERGIVQTRCRSPLK